MILVKTAIDDIFSGFFIDIDGVYDELSAGLYGVAYNINF